MSFAPTYFHTFLNTCDTNKDRLAFIYRLGEDEFRVTYEKFFEDVLILARAFKANKVRRGDKVFLLSDNRYAWIVTDLALQALGAVSIPRGSDTPPSEIEFIVNHSEAEFLILETEKLYKSCQQLIKSLKPRGLFIIAKKSTPGSTRPSPTRNCSPTAPSNRATSSGSQAWPKRSPPTTC